MRPVPIVHLDFKCKKACRCVSLCKPPVSARKDMHEKILACHAGHQEVGRCCTQRWIRNPSEQETKHASWEIHSKTLKLRPDIARIPKPSISCHAKPIFVVVHFLLLSMERTSCCSNSAALICWARTLITVPDLILCPLYLCLIYVYDIPDNFPFLANCGNVAFGVNERSKMCSFFAL